MSGLPGRLARWSRKRYPRACRSRRTASSGDVSRLLIRRIISVLAKVTRESLRQRFAYLTHLHRAGHEHQHRLVDWNDRRVDLSGHCARLANVPRRVTRVLNCSLRSHVAQCAQRPPGSLQHFASGVKCWRWQRDDKRRRARRSRCSQRSVSHACCAMRRPESRLETSAHR